MNERWIEPGKPMGKKGKKNKKFVMSLHEFIGSSNANAPVIQTTTSNWADEMADITFEGMIVFDSSYFKLCEILENVKK